jgi:hypothetical protein
LRGRQHGKDKPISLSLRVTARRQIRNQSPRGLTS